ncbi:MAG: hypothetical protein ABSF49_06425 [Roseiarcus sp.]|jgi:hypothetical protein|uniref:hypothetical protein n=1 Tax=Roseiarcus sp. TaxID=1969460 RepID=UPI003C1E1EBA
MALPADPPDIVILDLDRLDAQMVAQARRAFVGAEVVAVRNAYNEVDCVAVLETGVDDLARPFRAQDLLARVRAAEIRHLAAKSFQRHYRFGPLVIDLIDGAAARVGNRLARFRPRVISSFGADFRPKAVAVETGARLPYVFVVPAMAALGGPAVIVLSPPPLAFLAVFSGFLNSSVKRNA